MSTDPLENQYPGLTPFQYASNRPIDGVDKDGKEWSLTTSVPERVQASARQFEESNEGVILRFVQNAHQAMQRSTTQPSPSFSSTDQTRMEMARQYTENINYLNKVYNSDASMSIQIFNGIGAAADWYYPEVRQALSAGINLYNGENIEALDNFSNMFMIQSQRLNVPADWQQDLITTSSDGYTNFNDGYSREVTEINGVSIKNLSLANKTVNTKAGPVTFDEYGFPDFRPYSIKTVAVEGLTGQYAVDEQKALGAAQMTKTPEGYVWHHHQDAKTMMLVPKTLNNAPSGGVPHTGGSAVIKNNDQNPSNQLNFPSP